MIKILYLLLISVFLFISCNVSFPKETLQQDTIALIKKEAGVDTKVQVIGSTLYLDVTFDELATNDPQKISDIYGIIQKIVSNVVRVPLSSDANIKYIIVSAFDSKYQTLLRIFENISDIKLYSHQQISRTDYMERQLMEFEGPLTAKHTIENKYDLTEEEYVARLIISQINNSARTNPFLATLIQVLDLRYSHCEENSIYYLTKSIDNKEIQQILENMLKEESNKIIQKYKLFDIKWAILLDDKDSIVCEIKIEDNTKI